MSILIDQLIHNSEGVQAEINGRWYVAKNLTYPSLWYRLKEAWDVIRGRSRTYHYKQDEVVE